MFLRKVLKRFRLRMLFINQISVLFICQVFLLSHKTSVNDFLIRLPIHVVLLAVVIVYVVVVNSN